VDLKDLVLEMFNDYFNFIVPNFGMISLIPKINEATNIKQYMSICVLNILRC
jgi:hypothetical protein